MDEADLVAAIAADPDDDAPRAVYADWLMQRGDPRGELIALQCALARADAADAPLADEAGVVAREHELLATHRAEWIAPLREIADAGYTFRRGFVEHMDAHVAAHFTAETGDRLFAAAPLLGSLALPGNLIEQHPDAPYQGLAALALLETSSCGPAPLTVPHEHLRRLAIVNAQLDVERVRVMLAAPRALTTLVLGYGGHRTRIDDKALLAVVLAGESVRELRALQLVSVTLRDGVEQLAAFAKLDRLALLGCRVDPARLVALGKALPELTSLELTDGPWGPVAAPRSRLGKLRIAELLAAFPKLRRLRISDAGLGDDQAHELAASPDARRLRRLDLSNNKLGGAGVAALACSEHLDGLVALAVTAKTDDKEELAQLVQRHTHTHYARPFSPALPEVIELIELDQKIAAIKLYRERTGQGLADSKMAIDRLAEERDLVGERAWSTSGPRGAVARWI